MKTYYRCDGHGMVQSKVASTSGALLPGDWLKCDTCNGTGRVPDSMQQAF